MQQSPLTLPEIVDMPLSWGTAVPLLTVEVGGVELRPHLNGRDLKVRVKYGQPRDFVKCETRAVPALKRPRPAAADFSSRAAVEHQREPAVAHVDTTCLFRGHKDGNARITFSLLDASKGDATIARGELSRVPSSAGEVSYSVELVAAKFWKKEAVGRVDVKVEWCSVSKAALSLALQVMGATRQDEAYTAHYDPVIIGTLSESAKGEDTDSVVKGCMLQKDKPAASDKPRLGAGVRRLCFR